MGKFLKATTTIIIFVLSISVIIIMVITNMNDYSLKQISCKLPVTQIALTAVTLETRTSLGELVQSHNTNIRRYCEIHNYVYVFKTNYPSTLPVYWQKLELVLSTLAESDCSYCMWFDTDAIVNYIHIPMNLLINTAPTCSLWIGHTEFTPKSICAGVFLVKNNPIGRSFLERCIDIYKSREYCRSCKNGLAGKWAGECYEQGVMNEVALEKKYKPHIARVSPKFIYNGRRPHDSFILHYFGNKNRALKNIRKINHKIHDLPWTINPKPLRACVLLTTFSIPSRTCLYQEVIDAWEETGIPIYVVDSSRKRRLRARNYLCFNRSRHFDQIPKGASMMEKSGIHAAIKTFHLNKYDIVFKVTSRCSIQDLVSKLKYVPSGTDLIVQSNISTHKQTCECFGATVTAMSTLINRIDSQTPFERVIFNSLSKAEFQAVRLPRIK